MGTIFVDNLEPQSGTSLTLGASGDTIALASGASQTIVSNTPAFKATMSSGQSVANDTTTRLAFNSLTNGFDTDSAFNTSTNKFTIPSGKAGKYYFNMMIRSGSITDGKKVVGYLMKNGVEIDPGQFMNVSSNGSEQYSVIVTALFEMSVGDYAVAKVLHQSGSAVTFGTTGGVFQGFKLIE